MALPPPPESTVNMYELTFGTVCGVCAGIFVKKGAKALGFIFGGIFVMLQVSRQVILPLTCAHVNQKKKKVSWQHVDNKNRLDQGRISLREIVLYFGG